MADARGIAIISLDVMGFTPSTVIWNQSCTVFLWAIRGLGVDADRLEVPSWRAQWLHVTLM